MFPENSVGKYALLAQWCFNSCCRRMTLLMPEHCQKTSNILTTVLDVKKIKFSLYYNYAFPLKIIYYSPF